MREIKIPCLFSAFMHMVLCMEGCPKGISVMRWMGIEVTEPAQTERKGFAAVLSSSKEREIPGYNCQLATGRAITGSRDNDTPVQSQVER